MRSVCFILLLATLIQAQSCDNYGVQNGSTCACPTGFGGSTCSQPACGGTIFQGSQRPLAPLSNNVANLTQTGCSCENGWIGTACNVCQTSSACQSAFNASKGVQTTPDIVNNPVGVQNSSLTCDTSPRVWAGSQMSCRVDVRQNFALHTFDFMIKLQNPTLQAIYPLASTLNIIRTLQPAYTPIPNTTAFGPAGSVYAQLFYAGVEQFYCHADSCTQALGNGGASANWNCQNLQCTCRPGTTFCGAVTATDLTQTINGLSGTLGIECGVVDNSTNTSSCNFKQATIQSVFGSAGLILNGCAFGECVMQSVIDNGGNVTSSSQSSSGGKPLSGGVIAGLAVVGALVFLALVLLLFGCMKQRAARKARYGDVEGIKVNAVWNDVSYAIPTGTSFFGLWKGDSGDIGEKVVLDSVSGMVRAGQMMAILGPSGACVYL